MRAALRGELRQRPVVVEAGHGVELPAVEAGGVRGGDQAVGVGGIPDHQDTHVARGARGDGLALRPEDGAVGGEQVLPLHPRTARPGADQEGDVDGAEALVDVRRRDDAVEQREGAVAQLHRHALKGRERRGDLDEVQNDRLVRPEEIARGDAEEDRVSDIPGGAGDGNMLGFFHGRRILRESTCAASPLFGRGKAPDSRPAAETGSRLPRRERRGGTS